MKKRLFLLLSALMFAGLAPALQAQNNKEDKMTDTEIREALWTASLPGGQYTVVLSRVCSVAKQTYILDANLVVQEVTIETTGAALARFYYLEPVAAGSNSALISAARDRAKDLAKEAQNRAGANTGGMTIDTAVIKQYPTTSHAKTIEYRLQTSAQLDALLKSINTALWTGKGRSFQCR